MPYVLNMYGLYARTSYINYTLKERAFSVPSARDPEPLVDWTSPKGEGLGGVHHKIMSSGSAVSCSRQSYDQMVK